MKEKKKDIPILKFLDTKWSGNKITLNKGEWDRLLDN